MDSHFSIGDRVICKILDGHIAHHENDSYDETAIFEIIDNDFENGYIAYSVNGISLKDAIFIDKYNFNWYKLPDRFLYSEVVFLGDHHIYRVLERTSGMACVLCKEYSPMAEANYGNKFYCWVCRNYRCNYFK